MSNQFYFMIIVGIILVAPRNAAKNLAYREPYRGPKYEYQAIPNYPINNYDNSYVENELQLKVNRALWKLNEAFENGQKRLDDALKRKLSELEERLYNLKGSLKLEKIAAIKSIEIAAKQGLESVNSYSYINGKQSFAQFVEQQRYILQELISSAVPKFKYYIKQCKKYDTYSGSYGNDYNQLESSKYTETNTDKYNTYSGSYGNDYKSSDQYYNKQEPSTYTKANTDKYNTYSGSYGNDYKSSDQYYNKQEPSKYTEANTDKYNTYSGSSDNEYNIIDQYYNKQEPSKYTEANTDKYNTYSGSSDNEYNIIDQYYNKQEPSKYTETNTDKYNKYSESYGNYNNQKPEYNSRSKENSYRLRKTPAVRVEKPLNILRPKAEQKATYSSNAKDDISYQEWMKLYSPK